MSNPNTMQGKTFNFTLRADATNEPPSVLLANHIIELAETNTTEIRTVTHEAITSNTATGSTIPAVTDYRYYGATPNNYITFNDETWRIIGVFYDELTGTNRLKIINESIGTMLWDTRSTTTCEGIVTMSNTNKKSIPKFMAPSVPAGGINAWIGTCGGNTSEATINIYLNGTYYNSLTTSAKDLIANAIWYLGGYNVTSATTSFFYAAERGNETYNTANPPGDAYTRATYWNGTVGLMYPSDYGYAASDTCVSSTIISSYNTSCKSTDWLYNSSIYQWTMSPYSGSSLPVFYVASSGAISFFMNEPVFAVRPVLYLIAEAEYVEGDGSSGDPYKIS